MDSRQLNGMGDLYILVSYFDGAQRAELVKEAPKIPTIPKSKRLFLGHVIAGRARPESTMSRANPELAARQA